MSGASAERRPMGELEAAVLGVLWAARTPLTARQVQDSLPMPLARTTVATLLARLHGKGAVARQPAGRGYAYAAAQDRQGLTARRMHRELDKDADREVVLARFVSQLGPDDERILRELLEAPQEDTEPGSRGAAADRDISGPDGAAVAHQGPAASGADTGDRARAAGAEGPSGAGSAEGGGRP